MAESTQSRQLAAIVFTDIVDFTKAMEQDEGVAMELLRRQREAVPRSSRRTAVKSSKRSGTAF